LIFFCRIWVKVLMDEALRVIWPEGKSHAQPERVIWSGWLRMEGAFSFLLDFLFGAEDG